MSVYTYPLYFDIAFQYRDMELECDFIESVIEFYSKTDNRRILDIYCGTGPHILELSQRGYDIDGFDTSEEMLEYIRLNKRYNKNKTILWKDNLLDFNTDREYGILTNMLTSFNYIVKNEDVLCHLESAAKALSHGGIYIMELNHPRDLLSNSTSAPNAWIEERDDIEVEINWDFKNSPLDYIDQVYDVKGKMRVKHGDKETVLETNERIRIYLFQEIKTLIALSGWLSLVKVFGSFNIDQPLDNSEDSWRMILVLRKD